MPIELPIGTQYGRFHFEPLSVAVVSAALWCTFQFSFDIPAGIWEGVTLVGLLLYATVSLLRRRNLLGGAAILALTALFAYAALLTFSGIEEIEFNETLRSHVFVEPLLSRALYTLAIFNLIITAILLRYCPNGWEIRAIAPFEQRFARDMVIPVLIAAGVVALFTVRGPLILQAAYWSEEYARTADLQDKGLEVIGLFLMIFALLLAVTAYGWNSAKFRVSALTVVAMLIFFRLLRGERQSMMMFSIVFACLYVLFGKARLKWLYLGGLAIAMFIFLQLWAMVRWNIAETGGILESLQLSWEIYWESLGRSLLEVERLPQVYWNLLDTTSLYELGLGRNGETYTNLLAQQIPEVLAKAIGYERPESEPWVLARYVYHGGSILSVAEAYWNFGLAGVAVWAAVVALVFVGIERFFRKAPMPILYGYFGFFGLINGVLGGTQAYVRWLEIGILMTAVGYLIYPRTPRVSVSRPDSQTRRADKGGA